MSEVFLRRAQLDEKSKGQIHQRVKKLLKQKGQDSGDVSPDDEKDQDVETQEEDDGEGTVYLFDASEGSRRRVALEFDTRKEFEEYKKKYKIDPSTKVIIHDEDKQKKKDDIPEDKKPVKKNEGVPPLKQKEDKPEDKKDEKKDVQEKWKPEGKQGEPKGVSHPSRVPEGMQRQVAIKDHLIDEFGAEAKDWRVHNIHPSQMGAMVNIRFPDGSTKKYGQLSPDEKLRVDKAISDGLAASKGLSDYTSVSPATLQYNMRVSLDRYDDQSIEEPINDNQEPITKENISEVSSSIRKTGRKILEKYDKVMTAYSRPMAEQYVDDMSSALVEAIKDGSLSGVKQSDMDEFMRESVKRLLHQEVETRHRSLGDHGIRHVAGNCRSTMQILGELQGHGIKISGKNKMMALATMTDHDIGYTVGEAATDISKGKKHKEFSKQVVDQEKERMDKVFGSEDGEKVRTMIATHDDPEMDWDKDPVTSAVRLADNTALFGKDKVQDLFLRSPKATELACKLYLAATSKPDDKDLQGKIKKQLHEVVDGEFEQNDRELLHAQIDEMNEGKFSTTKDILSRFSGELDGFKFDPENKVMHVNMRYSSEGQMVDQLFGDDVACNQFNKFAKDLNGAPIRGKRGNTQFKNSEGKTVMQLNIDGFGEKDEPQTAAMRDFAKKTARTELNQASMMLFPPPDASQRDREKAKKALEPAKEKFTEEEWKKLMEEFDKEGGDPGELAKKLGMWPLLQSEFAFLASKTASDRMAKRIMIAVIGDRVAKEFLADTTLEESMGVVAGRGHQTQRKDKDLMSDTGGISKNRQRAPELKPPRTDSANRYRTKDKTPEQRDMDTDKVASRRMRASVHPLDMEEKSCLGFNIPEQNYHRQTLSALVDVMAESQHVSEKSFDEMDNLMKAAEVLVRSPKGEEIIQAFIAEGARPKMCAEGVFHEMVVKGRTSSENPERMAKSALASMPKTLREAVMRG